ncbi:sigma-E factor negative regulatory protein [Alcanivorax sp. 1008]|uniref:sigma-E factor negative regulatory protein n=1 Tax=Alcanivorax sp. 1008 TaxID=2816853 RepID=UPI001D5E1300|nr:sigma-E factor negative regulatory protein [Alcanivorax sp. 1008]MCC1495601.1 sigma-E factor negative regulatory protein [Alcanivorax sp. 1008]
MKQQSQTAPREEALSALFDNEVNELEARRLLRDMTDHDATRLGHWQLARDVMQRHAVAPVPEDFSARISAAVADEKQPRQWALPLARVAVAASVALATVVGWQYWDSNAANTAPALASSQQRPLLLGEGELVSRSLREQAQPAALVSGHQRIDDMIVRHSDFAARHGSQGLAPYARFISLEAQKEQQ